MTDGLPPYRSGFVEATSIGFKGLRDRLAEMLERGNRLRRRYSFTLLWMPAIAAFFVGIIAISAFKRGGLATTNGEPHRTIGEADTDPRPPAVTFATTEHFVLQGARAATIAESSGRATMFLASVSGGLVALGLVATASRVGTAFYAFGLVLLPTLAFVGLVTFERVLQSGIEDQGYARRIALLRGYYFDNAPELTPYLLSVAPSERLRVQGLWGGSWQVFRTVAGMVAVITAVLAGSTASLVAIEISDHSLAAALISGGLVALVALLALMRFQRNAWMRAETAPLIADEEEGTS